MPRRKKRGIRHAEIVRRFAERLRELRRSRGMTQTELGRRSSTSESYIRRLEGAAAAPGIDLLDRLAAALGVSATELLPAAAPADDLDVIRDQVRRQTEALLQSEDRQTLSLLAQFLARLSETTAH